MNDRAEYYRKELNLEPHQEGGYFYRSCLEENGLYSSIYFLLKNGEVSHFHQLEEDELWYHHDGDALTIYEIRDGRLNTVRLGRDIHNGECLQYLVRKGSIFGARMEGGSFALVGCMVCPAFTYEHFKLFTMQELMEKYPQHRDIIEQLTIE